MKRRPAVWAVLLIVLLVLVGCAAKQSMEGTWEQEITISVLGTNVDDQTEVSAIQRFQFHADGTGSMTTDAGEDFPVASVEFRYTLEEGELTLTRADGGEDMIFTVTLEKDSLKLENTSGTFDLKRVS